MTRNPLIATPTVDKNGRVTTVHKRADAAGVKVSSSIPKVSLPSEPQDNCKAIVESAFHNDVSAVKMSPNVRAKMMATLHPDTLPLMEKIFREYGLDIHTFRKATDWSADSRSFAILNSFVKLLHESEVKDREMQLYFLYGLRGVQMVKPGRKDIDITDPSDKRAAGARALVKAIIDYAESGLVMRREIQSRTRQAAYTFIEPEAGTLIIERPDRADEIVDLLRKHDMFDRGLFEATLDHDVRSLNDGVL